MDGLEFATYAENQQTKEPTVRVNGIDLSIESLTVYAFNPLDGCDISRCR